MNGKTKKNFLRIKQIAKQDEYYRSLMREYEILSPRATAVLEGLSKEQRSAIEDYLGLMGAVEVHLVLLACEHMDFPAES